MYSTVKENRNLKQLKEEEYEQECWILYIFAYFKEENLIISYNFILMYFWLTYSKRAEEIDKNEER